MNNQGNLCIPLCKERENEVTDMQNSTGQISQDASVWWKMMRDGKDSEIIKVSQRSGDCGDDSNSLERLFLMQNVSVHRTK